MNETLAYLQRAIEHAPKRPGQLSGTLEGWTVDGLYLCAFCAGRIIARGCNLPRSVEPIWVCDDVKHEACCLCNDEEHTW